MVYSSNILVSGNVLVLPIFDAHIGKMAWGEETGEDYDIRIAGKRYIQTIMALVERAQHIGIERIIFPIGQDFLHYTTHDQKTAKGTPQDSDLRWKKMYREGKNLLRDAILFMEKIAPVQLIFSPGNHDEIFSFFLMENIGDYFRNHPNVNWDGDIKARQYVRIGVNLIGFSHGNEEGNRLFELMQQEARELWGKTIYAEWIVGHTHQEKVEEKSGVVKRTVRSISGTDYWHYKKGFIGTLKAGQGIIYNEFKAGPYYILTEPITKGD
jgi:UDP-2,3-diacylglucosamine pyrophosphatase LpxH